MLTTSDRQPFCCQNIFTNNLCQYLNLHVYIKISRSTQVQSLAPPPVERRRQTGPIATLGH